MPHLRRTHRCPSMPALYKRIFTALLAINIWKTTSPFNLDVQYPIVYEDPSDNSERGSYFGYSVLLYAGLGVNKSAWIMVGAPRANSSFFEHSGIKEPGVVYRCTLWPPDTCQPLLLDRTGNEQATIGNGINYWDRKDGAWIGAAMDVQPGPGGRVVICGPRWIDQFYEESRSEYYQLGVCYWMQAEDTLNDGATTKEAEKALPLLDEDRLLYTQSSWKGVQVFDFGVAEAGMSVHMPLKKGIEENSELLLGAPGILNWRGGSILYQDGDNFVGGGLNKRFASIGSFSQLYTPNPDTSNKFREFSYLGYQVNSGYFFAENELLYVASAPRAVGVRGQVLLYKLLKKRWNGVTGTTVFIQGKVEGIQCGEYFGASLAVGDLNNDGLDDLIVGAPLFAKMGTGSSDSGLGYDEGRISVFLGSETWLMKEQQQIFGKKTGARFGSAISYLGDLDSNGFAEVGVGAPYEDGGRGVVYIFSGSLDGLLNEVVQRLIARDTHPSLRGFGTSINLHPADIDGNGCPDVAVGAYISGHAVVYRGRPVVRWIISPPSPNPEHIPRNATVLTLMAVCVTYLGINAPQNLAVWRTVEMDPTHLRCHKENRTIISETINLIRGERFCQNLEINMMPVIHNLLSPIEVNIWYQLPEEKEFEELSKNKERPEFKTHPIIVKRDAVEGTDNFCQDCPISQGSTRSEIFIPFEVECGGDNICNADLSITGLLPQLNKSSSAENLSFVIGSTKTLKFKVLVTNKYTAEPAYLTRVYVELGSPARISRIPPACHEILQPSFLNSLSESSAESDASSRNSSSYHSLSHGHDTMSIESQPRHDVNASSIYLRCDLDNPLHPTSTREVLVEVDMTNVHGSEGIQLTAWATTASNESNPSDNWWSLYLPLRIEADIAIAGRAVKELYTYFKENKNENESRTNFLHIYEVQKLGYSPVQKVDIVLQIPVSIENERAKNPITFLEIKVYEGNQGGQPLPCFVSSTTGHEEEIPTDQPPTNSFEKKFMIHGKSDNAIPMNHISMQVPSNRTLYLNCSSLARRDNHPVTCISIVCPAGPFLNSLVVAKVLLSLELDIKPLQTVMGLRDIILLETQGFVNVIEPVGLIQPRLENPDQAWTATLFMGDIPEKEVESWVLALAIGAGIMLLLFLAMALAKAGFFERKKKDELKALKRETIAEVADGDDTADEQEIENSE